MTRHAQHNRPSNTQSNADLIAIFLIAAFASAIPLHMAIGVPYLYAVGMMAIGLIATVAKFMFLLAIAAELAAE